MSETRALTTTAGGVPTPNPLALIEGSGKAASTTRLYTGVLVPYLDNGGNLADVDALKMYSESLPASRRRHLRAAVSLWAKEAGQRLKASDTPDRHLATEAALNRLDALSTAVKVEEVKGRKAHTWLTSKQVTELMATCGPDLVGRRDSVVLGVLGGAGLRRAELAGLRWEHIKTQPVKDRLRTVLDVHGKGAKDRVVPISDKLADILDQWAGWTGREGYVVRSLGMSQEIGDSLSDVAIFHIVQKHGADIGIPELAPHDLRRTYAQIGYDAGVPITQISILLGHANVTTTQRYLNLELDLDTTASDFVPL